MTDFTAFTHFFTYDLDLENLFSNVHEHGKYLWQVSLKFPQYWYVERCCVTQNRCQQTENGQTNSRTAYQKTMPLPHVGGSRVASHGANHAWKVFQSCPLSFLICNPKVAQSKQHCFFNCNGHACTFRKQLARQFLTFDIFCRFSDNANILKQ